MASLARRERMRVSASPSRSAGSRVVQPEVVTMNIGGGGYESQRDFSDQVKKGIVKAIRMIVEQAPPSWVLHYIYV